MPNPDLSENLRTLYVLFFSLIAVIIGFSYLQYLAPPLPDAVHFGLVATMVLGVSIISGWATRDALTAFGTASISAFSLSLSTRVLVVKTEALPSRGEMVGLAPVSFPGLALSSIILVSLAVAIGGGLVTATIAQSLLQRGPLSRRIVAFWRPIIAYADQHQGFIGLIGIVVTAMVTFLVTWYFARR